MKKKLYYKETGMFIDWKQLSQLPKIQNFIDIGIGEGTKDLWRKYKNKRIICIDPLEESEILTKKILKGKNYSFHKVAVGSKNKYKTLFVEKSIGRSTLLRVTNKNFEGKPIKKVKVQVKTLDSIINKLNLKGKNGIKIDVEGYELEVLKGSTKTLKNTRFIIVEARHNHKTFHNQYPLRDLMILMAKNKFFLTKIFTAKPFIADLCFEPKK